MPTPSQVLRRLTRVMAGLATLVLIVALGSLAASQVNAPLAQPKPEAAADPLLTLNNSSRLLYTLAKQNTLAKSGPVMIVVGDDLVFRHGDKRTQARVIPDIYHTLKTFDHIALAIDVTLAAHEGETPIPEDVLTELREYQALLPPARERIATCGLNAEQRERQKTIVDACSEFLGSVLDQRKCPAEMRIHFTRRMTPLMMANAAAAARAVLDAMHRQVMAWKATLTPQDWSRLTVLVVGRQLPRKDNLAVQYFARLLGEPGLAMVQPGEGKRIIYAEGLGDEPRALDLLATHRVDTRVAIDFFNDPQRMARDVLSDVTRDYLPLLFDKPE